MTCANLVSFQTLNKHILPSRVSVHVIKFGIFVEVRCIHRHTGEQLVSLSWWNEVYCRYVRAYLSVCVRPCVYGSKILCMNLCLWVHVFTFFLPSFFPFLLLSTFLTFSLPPFPPSFFHSLLFQFYSPFFIFSFLFVCRHSLTSFYLPSFFHFSTVCSSSISYYLLAFISYFLLPHVIP